jgi:hypothetical protein
MYPLTLQDNLFLPFIRLQVKSEIDGKKYGPQACGYQDLTAAKSKHN